MLEPRPPGPRPRTPINNPLPPPPRDIYDTTPYRSLLTLPQTTALLTSTYGTTTAPQRDEPLSRRKSRRGLFPSLSTRRKREEERPVPLFPVYIPQPQQQQSQSQPQPQQSQPQSQPQQPIPQPQPQPNAPPQQPIPPPDSGPPPVRFDHQGPLAGFMNHSPHRVIHQNKTYPTALHLHEALKYLGHRPDLAEQIRHCTDVLDVYPLSATFHEFGRRDWGEVFLKTVRATSPSILDSCSTS